MDLAPGCLRLVVVPVDLYEVQVEVALAFDLVMAIETIVDQETIG